MPHQAYAIDLGSYKTLIGYCGGAEPLIRVPSVAAKEKNGGSTCLYGDMILGEDTEHLDLSRLIVNGEIKDYDAIFEQFVALGTSNDGSMDLSTDTVVASVDTFAAGGRQPERLMETFFEKGNLGSFYANDPAFFSMVGARRTTGTVLDVGHSGIRFIPLKDLRILRENVVRGDLGAQDVTAFFNGLLDVCGNKVMPLTELTVDQAKIATTLSALNFSSERGATNDQCFHAPDGTWIDVPGEVRVSAPELFFQPQLWETTMQKPSITDLYEEYYSRIYMDKKINEEGRTQIMNALLTGGASLTPNFEARLAETMPELPIEARTSRETLPWCGASLFGVLEGFSTLEITRKMYEEEGKARCAEKLMK